MPLTYMTRENLVLLSLGHWLPPENTLSWPEVMIMTEYIVWIRGRLLDEQQSRPVWTWYGCLELGRLRRVSDRHRHWTSRPVKALLCSITRTSEKFQGLSVSKSLLEQLITMIPWFLWNRHQSKSNDTQYYQSDPIQGKLYSQNLFLYLKSQNRHYELPYIVKITFLHTAGARRARANLFELKDFMLKISNK